MPAVPRSLGGAGIAAALGLIPDESEALPFFHGSPHKFTKFSTSKIGTGEGAQAFGHGLYFAENPKVAKSYMPKNLGPAVTLEGKEVPWRELSHTEGQEIMQLWQSGS